MSLMGKQTPLTLNTQAQLAAASGLDINSTAKSYQGEWTAATPYNQPTSQSYTQGTLTSTNLLNKLTLALPNFYNMTPSQICVVTWRNLIKIGRPIDSRSQNSRINCPALGNSRPDSFKPSYAGYGSFENNKLVDSFGNVTTGSGLGLVKSEYPPNGYPVSGTKSYVYNNWSSLTASPGAPNDCTQTTFTAWQEPYQYLNEYAWITGWPGQYAWQSKTVGNPQVANDPTANLDTYAAAYFPRPDLAGTQPWRSRDVNKIEYDEYFKWGFVATVARQAYYEFWSAKNNRRPNQYPEFIKSFQIFTAYQSTANPKISSLVNSKTFLRGNYSNINDITTADIAGISLSFKIFGNDMIRLGKAVDLANIAYFGLPSKLLLNLQKWNALTASVKLALLFCNLTDTEINNILSPSFQTSPEQEKKIYDSFLLIKGSDLDAIKTILNIQTGGLTSLADLIDPKKMFPNSYKTLTTPVYNTDTLSAKNYYFIYNGENTNTAIPTSYSAYLSNILPPDLQLACAAFMVTINQVKNIQSMDFEAFAQVVANLEVTNKDLPLINTNTGVPVDATYSNSQIALNALGSGSSGVYRFCDFLGAMSGWPYRDYYSQAQSLINQIQTDELSNIYKKLYQLSLNNLWALPSRGKGYPDTYINPAPTAPASAAYTVFRITASAGIGSTVLNCTSGINAVLSASDVITFNNQDSLSVIGTTYVVSSITSNSITVSTPLSAAVNQNDYIFVQIGSYDGTYPNPTPGSGAIQDLIDAANLEILRIQTINFDGVKQLNYYWDKIGDQLFIEQRAIPYAVNQTDTVYADLSSADLEAFINGLGNWALSTQYSEVGPILEAIADTNTVGGSSLVANQRESRNAQRIANIGGSIDSEISDNLNPTTASAIAVIANGAIVHVVMTSSGHGYTTPPVIVVGPMGGVFGGNGQGAVLEAYLDNNTGVAGINIISGGTGYTSTPPIYIANPPQPARIGDATEFGNFNGSPYTGQYPIPDNLVAPPSASYTVQEAINEVTICNCDCWTN